MPNRDDTIQDEYNLMQKNNYLKHKSIYRYLVRFSHATNVEFLNKRIVRYP